MRELILIVISIASAVMGVVFAAAPRKTINAQIAFYRLINWNVEPISWEKEIRNTRIMGILAILCSIVGFVATRLPLRG